MSRIPMLIPGSSARLAFFPSVRHERCIVKRTRNGVRVKVTRFSEISEAIKKRQVEDEKVGWRKRRIKVATLDVEFVRFDVHSKLRDRRFVRARDQLLAFALSQALSGGDERTDRRNDRARDGAARARDGGNGSGFYGGSPCFEKVRVEATDSKRGENPHPFNEEGA